MWYSKRIKDYSYVFIIMEPDSSPHEVTTQSHSLKDKERRKRLNLYPNIFRFFKRDSHMCAKLEVVIFNK